LENILRGTEVLKMVTLSHVQLSRYRQKNQKSYKK